MRLASQKVRNISKGLQYIKTLQYTKKLEIYNRFENNSREPQSNNVLLFPMFLDVNHKATPLQSAFPC